MDKKILLIGDLCVDEFIYGITERKSPEGDGLIFKPIKRVVQDGMGGNVKRHLKGLGYTVDVFFPISSIKKTRFLNIQTNHLYLRVDENDWIDREINVKEINNIKEYDAILISDYCKGFITMDSIYSISKENENCFLDTKKLLGDWCKHLKHIKINRDEYRKNQTFINGNDWIKKKIIKTLDDEGVEYNDKMFPTKKIVNADVSGAGDAFFASFFVKFLETNDVNKSIRFGIAYSYQFLINKKNERENK